MIHDPQPELNIFAVREVGKNLVEWLVNVFKGDDLHQAIGAGNQQFISRAEVALDVHRLKIGLNSDISKTNF